MSFFFVHLHADLMEYILNSQGLNTPSTYLYRYTTPVEIVLESGKQVFLPLYCYMNAARNFKSVEKSFLPLGVTSKTFVCSSS